MHVHTSLTHAEMLELPCASGAPIAFHKLEERGSRSRAHAYIVRLTGTGGASNTGLYGAGDYSGATWDQWGAFIGALFDADPAARIPAAYETRTHFRAITGGRFDRNAAGHHYPADTHPRHRWTHPDGYREPAVCGICSAVLA